MKRTSKSERNWKVAVEEAERVNALFTKGYVAVSEGDDRIIRGPFQITDDEITLGSSVCYQIWHSRTADLDHGAHDTVEQIRQRFRRLQFLQPVKSC